MKSIRKDRLEAIKTIVAEKRIGTQEELAAELEMLGFEVAQATVSRDMADLGLLKVRGDEGSYYSLPEVERLRSLLKTFWANIDWSENIVVIKTAPGAAQGVAAAIDDQGWSEVVGTVGGDDTILVVSRNAKGREAVMGRLRALFEE